MALLNMSKKGFSVVPLLVIVALIAAGAFIVYRYKTGINKIEPLTQSNVVIPSSLPAPTTSPIVTSTPVAGSIASLSPEITADGLPTSGPELNLAIALGVGVVGGFLIYNKKNQNNSKKSSNSGIDIL